MVHRVPPGSPKSPPAGPSSAPLGPEERLFAPRPETIDALEQRRAQLAAQHDQLRLENSQPVQAQADAVLCELQALALHLGDIHAIGNSDLLDDFRAHAAAAIGEIERRGLAPPVDEALQQTLQDLIVGAQFHGHHAEHETAADLATGLLVSSRAAAELLSFGSDTRALATVDEVPALATERVGAPLDRPIIERLHLGAARASAAGDPDAAASCDPAHFVLSAPAEDRRAPAGEVLDAGRSQGAAAENYPAALLRFEHALVGLENVGRALEFYALYAPYVRQLPSAVREDLPPFGLGTAAFLNQALPAFTAALAAAEARVDATLENMTRSAEEGGGACANEVQTLIAARAEAPAPQYSSGQTDIVRLLEQLSALPLTAEGTYADPERAAALGAALDHAQQSPDALAVDPDPIDACRALQARTQTLAVQTEVLRSVLADPHQLALARGHGSDHRLELLISEADRVGLPTDRGVEAFRHAEQGDGGGALAHLLAFESECLSYFDETPAIAASGAFAEFLARLDWAVAGLEADLGLVPEDRTAPTRPWVYSGESFDSEDDVDPFAAFADLGAASGDLGASPRAVDPFAAFDDLGAPAVDHPLAPLDVRGGPSPSLDLGDDLRAAQAPRSSLAEGGPAATTASDDDEPALRSSRTYPAITGTEPVQSAGTPTLADARPSAGAEGWSTWQRGLSGTPERPGWPRLDLTANTAAAGRGFQPPPAPSGTPKAPATAAAAGSFSSRLDAEGSPEQARSPSAELARTGSAASSRSSDSQRSKSVPAASGADLPVSSGRTERDSAGRAERDGGLQLGDPGLFADLFYEALQTRKPDPQSSASLSPQSGPPHDRPGRR